MTAQINTHKMIAAEVAADLEENAPFLMQIDRSREKEFAKAPNGFKIGNEITISVNGVGKVYDGVEFAEGGTPDDWEERSVKLKIDNQRHTAVDFSAHTAVFELPTNDPRRQEFRQRVLKPQMSSLVASIEADLIRDAVLHTPNIIGTPGVTPTTMKTFNLARKVLNKSLAPARPRSALISSDINVEMVDSSKALFNPGKEISNQYRESNIGRYAGMDFDECINLPSVTNGSKVTGVSISAMGPTNSSLIFAGVANGDTFKKGQVFTIAGVNMVHRLTGTEFLTEPQQFVIAEDATAGGATVEIKVYPELKAMMPNKTVGALPVGSAAVSFFGAAGQTYTNSLVFQQDAFTAAFVAPPIVVDNKDHGYQWNSKGVRFTVQTGGNFTNLSSATRIDVWWGSTAVRGYHACRIAE